MLEYIRFTTRSGQQGKLSVDAFSHWLPAAGGQQGELHTISGTVIYVVNPHEIEEQLTRFEIDDVDDGMEFDEG